MCYLFCAFKGVHLLTLFTKRKIFYGKIDINTSIEHWVSPPPHLNSANTTAFSTPKMKAILSIAIS